MNTRSLLLEKRLPMPKPRSYLLERKLPPLPKLSQMLSRKRHLEGFDLASEMCAAVYNP